MIVVGDIVEAVYEKKLRYGVVIEYYDGNTHPYVVQITSDRGDFEIVYFTVWQLKKLAGVPINDK